MTFTSDLLVQRTDVGQRMSVKEQGRDIQYPRVLITTLPHRLSMSLSREIRFIKLCHNS